ncbi:oxidoreductase [Pseudomonas lopnurensis]|uniref:oxidoreductase n=1 Tax=Pseudomonas lopnurensis TaxID=1477517 RepID=UPI0028A6F2EF|nr:oxidoreductase [Pseudomonas lopnurensis]
MKLKFDLSHKVVLVTGGAGLLGEAFSRGISEAGAKVVIAEKTFSVAESARDKIIADIPNAIVEPVELDITSENSIRHGLLECERIFGGVDALVNNAYPRNKNYGKAFFEVQYEDFCDNVSMNLGGYFVTSKVFAEYFKIRGRGNIVNISSIYGVVSPSFDIYEGVNMTMPVEYSVIKSGLLHLTKYMAKYLAGSGVRVNALSPGGILDGQNSEFIRRYNEKCFSKGMLEKEDMIGSLVFLLSDESMYINGQNLIVDDGFTV